MARLFRGYQSSGNGKSILPPFEQFEAKFREAFGRELTREERRFYRLIEIVLAESVAETLLRFRMVGTFSMLWT